MNASFRRLKICVLRARLRLLAVVLLFLAGETTTSWAQIFSIPPRTGDWQQGFTLIIMNHTEAAAANQARDFVKSRGGRIAALVPPRVMMGWVAPELSQDLIGQHGIEQITHTPVARARFASNDAATRSAVSFFNAVVSGALATEQAAAAQASGEPLRNDALAPPILDEEAYAENLRAFGLAASPAANSSDMIGTVAVALFFVESNGAIDPNTYTWSADDEQNTFNRALSGLTWWADQASAFGPSLTFSVSLYGATHVAAQQGYEPILRASSDDHLWIEAITANLGFNQGDKIARVTAFNTWLKNNLETDWAYTAFIGYNPPPAPTRFNDGYFAYAHLGGPFTQLLFKNDGWAVEDFGKIFSHETGHVFWACDEYFESGYGGCASCGACAPLGPRPTTENGNCETCNSFALECMMRSNSSVLCSFTPYQIGWRGNCAYTIAPTSRPHGPEAGSGAVNVVADPGCDWIALSLSTWITVTSGQGRGNGSVSYEIAANSGDAARTGYLNVAGRLFTIRQEGSAFAFFTEVSAPFLGLTNSAAAWGDYDRDGDLDFIVAGMNGGAHTKLYRNDNGQFTEAQTAIVNVYNGALVWGDYDNDNDLDLLLSGTTDGADAVAKIYRNDAGNFIAIGAPLTGLQNGDAVWGDYDNDGYLDAIVSGETSAAGGSRKTTKLYRQAQGNFVAMSHALAPVSQGELRFADFDRDTDLDLLLTGYRDAGPPHVAIVYRNDNGVFTDISAPLTGVNAGSAAWGDFNGDGDLDIALSGLSNALQPVVEIYRYQYPGFIKAPATLPGLWAGSVRWGDYDNDGDLDLLLTGSSSFNQILPETKIFRNDQGQFGEEQNANLTNAVFGEAVWGDYDNDGDLDVLLLGSDGSRPVTKLFRNNVQTPNTPPSPPPLDSAAVKDDRVVLAWAGANDVETTAGLTYNVRVGTTPGAAEILSPQSLLATGQRLVPQLGNASQAFSATIRNLPDGKYYWSAQALDNAFAGSAFAPEQTFTLPLCVSHGDVNNDGVLTPGDAFCAFYIYLTGALPRDCDAPTSPCEAVASDVNCDATTTPGDALAIFQRYLQGLPPEECFARTALAKSMTPYRIALQPRRRVWRTNRRTIARRRRLAKPGRAFRVWNAARLSQRQACLSRSAPHGAHRRMDATRRRFAERRRVDLGRLSSAACGSGKCRRDLRSVFCRENANARSRGA